MNWNSVRFTIICFFTVQAPALKAFDFEQEDFGSQALQQERVLHKIFTKKDQFEFHGLAFGGILNEAYNFSTFLQSGVSYFFSENWGLSFEATKVFPREKSSRRCIESFIYDPDQQVRQECGVDHLNENDEVRATYTPAYVPIRTLQGFVNLNGIWSPIYGKQLAFARKTSYFDIYLPFGVGASFSKFHPKKTTLDSGRRTRGPISESTSEFDLPGAQADQRDLVGRSGRPTAKQEISPTINFGLGQKIHFWNQIFVKMEFRYYAIFSQETSGANDFFTLSAGSGLKF